VFAEARNAGSRETADQYRADALVELATGCSRTQMAPGDHGGRPGSRPRTDPKTMVNLRVDLAALRRGQLEPGEVCEIPGVGPVPLSRARELMGDAITSLVITDGVDVYSVTRTGRTIPAPVRTALMERDRTCVVPGCDVALGLEIDHWRIPVANEGPTELANLVRICKHHHYLRHHKGFALSGGPDRWRWDPPRAGEPPPGTGHHHAEPPLFTLEE